MTNARPIENISQMFGIWDFLPAFCQKKLPEIKINLKPIYSAGELSSTLPLISMAMANLAFLPMEDDGTRQHFLLVTGSFFSAQSKYKPMIKVQ